MIPYVNAIDQEEVQWCSEAVTRLLPRIERRVCARELTAELLHDWGLLNSCAGALGLTYIILSPTLGALEKPPTILLGTNFGSPEGCFQSIKPRKLEAARDEMERIINSLVNGSLRARARLASTVPKRRLVGQVARCASPDKCLSRGSVSR